ncbi:MAG: IS3 family transposase [Nitrosomonas sp.]|nr:IS3 family transposase [Nitrosomonas sp.]
MIFIPWRDFWGILKTELVHHRRFKTRQQAIQEITK